MNCDTIRGALSARIDGEATGLPDAVVDAHLAGCEACRRYLAFHERLRRSLAVREAEPVPDLSREILTAASVADRERFWWVLRGLLAVVALVEFAVSVQPLFLGTDGSAAEHVTRHLGSFSTTFAVGLLVVAWRPAKARSLIPLTATLAGCLVVTAAVDTVKGYAYLWGELHHLVEIAGLVLVWILALPSAWPGHGAPQRSRGTNSPPLRLVNQDSEQRIEPERRDIG